jgi:hypothetical protein
MDAPKREQKRQSSKKQREYSVYSKKAVRAKEALLEKTCGGSFGSDRAHVNTCAVPAKPSQTK